MKKESIKKFWKKNWDLIVAGACLIGCAAIAVAIGKAVTNPNLAEIYESLDPKILDLLGTVDEATKGCTAYARVTPSEVASVVDVDGVVRDCLRDPDGKLFEIKNLIAFGN